MQNPAPADPPSPQASAQPADSRFGHVFRALRHRNYRLFFGGQLISVVGTFLTNTAMIWLAFLLTKNPIEKASLIGIVAFSSQIPVFLLSPFAGVWVDRLNRRHLLIFTQSASMLQSFALAALAIPHLINIPEVIVLALAQGTINAFDIPGRQAFLIEMITDRQDLSNGIALNSTIVHSARLIGPACAGLLIHWIGTGACFLIDGFSYIAVISAFVAMRTQPRPPRPRKSALHELHEGFRYVAGFTPARVLLILIATFSLTGAPSLMVLMPLFGNHFGGATHGDLVFGFLSAASGVGALAGAVRLAARKSVVGLGRIIGMSSILFALALAGFALSNHLWISLMILPFAGWGMFTNTASANTILQTLVDDDKRGRVMSFFAMSFMGMMPFGVLMSGQLATRLSYHGNPITGARWTILIAAGVCALATVWYWIRLPTVRSHVRPIYVKRGILQEIADGIQMADAAAPAGEA